MPAIVPAAARPLLARVVQGALVVALVASVVFVLVRLAPGDPFAASLDDPALAADVRARWRAAYGLDGPIGAQYVRWLGALARGDLGWSTSRQAPVARVLADALPWTLLLGGVAFVLAFGGGMAIGAWQARRRDGAGDRALTALGSLTTAMPDFWLALVLLLAFAWRWPVLPVGGARDPLLAEGATALTRALDVARHLVLPAATLALTLVGAIARLQRSAALDQARAEWVRTARAKGVAGGALWRRHVWRTALLPLVTLGGLALPALLGASVFVEHVFAWPGLGGVVAAAIAARDYHLVTGCALLGTTLTVLGAALADGVAVRLDPRVRDARAATA